MTIPDINKLQPDDKEICEGCDPEQCDRMCIEKPEVSKALDNYMMEDK
jgi:hypothetical protein